MLAASESVVRMLRVVVNGSPFSVRSVGSSEGGTVSAVFRFRSRVIAAFP